MRLRHRMNDRFGQAWVHWELAECHLAAGDPAAALAEFAKSHRIFTELDPPQAALALGRIAEVRARMEAAEPA